MLTGKASGVDREQKRNRRILNMIKGVYGKTHSYPIQWLKTESFTFKIRYKISIPTVTPLLFNIAVEVLDRAIK